MGVQRPLGIAFDKYWGAVRRPGTLAVWLAHAVGVSLWDLGGSSVVLCYKRRDQGGL